MHKQVRTTRIGKERKNKCGSRCIPEEPPNCFLDNPPCLAVSHDVARFIAVCFPWYASGSIGSTTILMRRSTLHASGWTRTSRQSRLKPAQEVSKRSGHTALRRDNGWEKCEEEVEAKIGLEEPMAVEGHQQLSKSRPTVQKKELSGITGRKAKRGHSKQSGQGKTADCRPGT
jgi:hypothetical protein